MSGDYGYPQTKYPPCYDDCVVYMMGKLKGRSSISNNPIQVADFIKQQASNEYPILSRSLINLAFTEAVRRS